MKLYVFTPTLLIGIVFSFLSLPSSPQLTTKNTPNTGSIEGLITLAPKSQPVRFGGGLYGRPAPSGSDTSPNDSILVVLTGSSSETEGGSQLEYLNQKDQQFAPQLLPIELNQTLRIQNSDPVYHNVFSLTSPHKFDVGRRPKGEHFDVTFEKAGVIDVFCDIHSNMHAIIYVLPGNALSWTKVKSGETYRFTHLREGNYELKFYALGYQESAQTVSLQDSQTFQAKTITLNP